jgi:glycosyltransferase involved in cell wall biosynthesis
MRIAYLSFVEIDICNACLVHTREIVEQLSSLGHEVTLFMPRPKKKQQWQRVQHVWIRLWAFSGIKTWFFHFEIALRLLRLHHRNRFELVYLREMDHNGLIPALCKWIRLPMFVEVNGWLLSDLHSAGASSRKVKQAQKKQRSDFQKTAGLVATTQGVARKITEQYGIDRERILLQELGSNPSLFRPGDKKSARTSLGLPASHPIYLFAGSFAQSQDLFLLIDAFSRVVGVCGQSLLLMLGKGIQSKSVDERTKNLGIRQKVIFAGSIPYEQVSRWMQAADVGVIPLTESNIRLRNGCMTLKLWDYMASALPVIVTDLPDSSTYCLLKDRVIITPPGDVEKMTQAMTTLISDEQKRKALGSAGRDFVIQNRTWRHAALDTDHFIRKRLHGYSDPRDCPTDCPCEKMERANSTATRR